MENDESEMFGNYSRKILTDALVNVRQHEICLKTLLHDIINCAKNVENLQIQLAQRLDQLKSTVQSKTAIPTAQVYVNIFWLFFKKFKMKLLLLLLSLYKASVHSISYYLDWFSRRISIN